jgi:hypothetical protein
MPIDQLRRELMQRIDSLLGRTLLVWGRDRQILSALRGYVATMTAEELEKIDNLLAYHKDANTKDPNEVT